MEMNNKYFREVLPKLDELAKFFKFKRKKIKEEIEVNLEEVDKEFVSLQKSIQKLTNDHQELTDIKRKQENEITGLNHKNEEIALAINKIQSEFNTLEKEHLSVKERFDLISEVLSVKPNLNAGLEKFKTLFNHDFMEFANDESSLAEEAEAILLLQEIEKELELIVSLPAVYSKTIIAIGGGFSSGKSAFVNSFIKNKTIKLPIGIKPVTAIPSYVVSDDKDSIKGFSKKGGSIDIKAEYFEKLSRSFVESFNFNLKDIMPFMAIGTSLNREYLKQICLIDTPGYNPPSTEGFTDEDKKTAIEYLKQADALIWMIGVDSNGTIPASDLDFMRKLDLTNKKLYIVANKADEKPDNELKDILDEIVETVKDYDIELKGISAFSSNLQKEYLFRKISLFDFLKKENNVVKKQKDFEERIDHVFDMYKDAIKKDIKFIDSMKGQLKTLELDLLELGHDSDDNKLVKSIEKIKKNFNKKELTQQLQRSEEIRIAIKSSIKEIFKSIDK